MKEIQFTGFRFPLHMSKGRKVQ